jgi:hypothetical protein
MHFKEHWLATYTTAGNRQAALKGNFTHTALIWLHQRCQAVRMRASRLCGQSSRRHGTCRAGRTPVGHADAHGLHAQLRGVVDERLHAGHQRLAALQPKALGRRVLVGQERLEPALCQQRIVRPYDPGGCRWLAVSHVVTQLQVVQSWNKSAESGSKEGELQVLGELPTSPTRRAGPGCALCGRANTAPGPSSRCARAASCTGPATGCACTASTATAAGVSSGAAHVLHTVQAVLTRRL